MGLYLIIFALILFLGVKIAPKGQFNEDFLSLKISKGLQGFFAICIITHHFSQPYLGDGGGAGLLTPFALIGFLFVGVFFFFSGYGLYKSYKTKPGYLNGFLRKRLPVVLVPLYIINAILTLIVIASNGTMYSDGNPICFGYDNIIFRITTFLGITLMNSNAWYMITIAIFYIVFYLAFRKNRDEDKAFKIMGIFSVVYIVLGILAGHGPFWLQGEWWYNSSLLLFIGMYVAKNEKKVISYIQSRYAKIMILCSAGTVVMTIVAIFSTLMLSYYRPGVMGKVYSVLCLICETSATTLFVAFVLIGTMKVKLNNKILDFLGKIALEVYLVHRFFIVFLNSQYVTIDNKLLYLTAVYSGTIIVSIILHKVDEVIVQVIKGKGKVRADKSELYRA